MVTQKIALVERLNIGTIWQNKTKIHFIESNVSIFQICVSKMTLGYGSKFIKFCKVKISHIFTSENFVFVRVHVTQKKFPYHMVYREFC